MFRFIIETNNAFFEAILINDGSTDNSASILCDYCRLDSRFTLITQNNSGLSMARNVGLEKLLEII